MLRRKTWLLRFAFEVRLGDELSDCAYCASLTCFSALSPRTVVFLTINAANQKLEALMMESYSELVTAALQHEHAAAVVSPADKSRRLADALRLYTTSYVSLSRDLEIDRVGIGGRSYAREAATLAAWFRLDCAALTGAMRVADALGQQDVALQWRQTLCAEVLSTYLRGRQNLQLGVSLCIMYDVIWKMKRPWELWVPFCTDDTTSAGDNINIEERHFDPAALRLHSAFLMAASTVDFPIRRDSDSEIDPMPSSMGAAAIAENVIADSNDTLGVTVDGKIPDYASLEEAEMAYTEYSTFQHRGIADVKTGATGAVSTRYGASLATRRLRLDEAERVHVTCSPAPHDMIFFNSATALLRRMKKLTAALEAGLSALIAATPLSDAVRDDVSTNGPHLIADVADGGFGPLTDAKWCDTEVWKAAWRAAVVSIEIAEHGAL